MSDRVLVEAVRDDMHSVDAPAAGPRPDVLAEFSELASLVRLCVAGPSAGDAIAGDDDDEKDSVEATIDPDRPPAR